VPLASPELDGLNTRESGMGSKVLAEPTEAEEEDGEECSTASAVLMDRFTEEGRLLYDPVPMVTDVTVVDGVAAVIEV
jgi:hypothetical protein